MEKSPLDLERLIGWISFALGASALQPNDSTFYRILAASGVPLFWILAFCVSGAALVITARRRYAHYVRCRMLWLAMLLALWASGLIAIVISGPLGAFGAVGIVMVSFLARILWMKVRAEAIVRR